MTRKDGVIAVLVIFCLTATLFLVKPTGSQTSGQYDPWADVTGPNGVPDGKIDIRDISYVATRFGTTGDSTRNVNVTNWPTGLTSGSVNVTIGSLNHYSIVEYVAVGPPPAAPFTQIFSIEGFRQVSLDVGGANSTKHSLWISMGLYDNITGGHYYETFFENIPTINGTTFADAYVETIAVQGPGLQIVIFPYFGQTSTDWFTLGIYATC